jgi:predicted ribosomally synthesized peptide with SipW-like signal peptide
MKKKKIFIILSVAVVFVLVLAFGAIGVNAWFVDQETSKGNVFEAGTLDLKVDGKDDPEVVHYELGPLKPDDTTIGPGAWATGALYWTIKNDGNIPGILTAKITNVVNYENGQNEPEALVDPTAGDLQGELGG